MLTEVSGNLLDAEVDALVNAVNTAGVMGKGIALDFKRAFPANFDAYRLACRRGKVRLGELLVVATGQERPRWIVNFPTKAHWRSRSRLADLEAGLAELARVATELGIGSLAVPALASGNGGLPWDQVRPLLHGALADLPATDVLLYLPGSS